MTSQILGKRYSTGQALGFFLGHNAPNQHYAKQPRAMLLDMHSYQCALDIRGGIGV